MISSATSRLIFWTGFTLKFINPIVAGAFIWTIRLPSAYKYPLCAFLLIVSLAMTLRHIQERPGEMTHVPRIDNLNYFNPPALSTHDMEAIEHMLSYGFIPDKSRIDAKTCLLVIYHILIDWLRPPPRLRSDATILVSPMRRARAARLTFDREFRFKWSGWWIKRVEPKVEMSRVTIENDSWTRYVKYEII